MGRLKKMEFSGRIIQTLQVEGVLECTRFHLEDTENLMHPGARN